MLQDVPSETLTLAVVGALGLVVMIVLLAAAVVGVSWVVRRRGGVAQSREEVLSDIGFVPHGQGIWSMSLPRADLHFEEEGPEGGYRWSVNLPRYNTLTLRVYEQAEAPESPLGRFQSRNPALDARFALYSRLPAQTLALLMDQRVVHTLLALPYVRMVLSGDELVLTDPRGVALDRLASGARPGSPEHRAAEAELHQSVAALAMAILTTLYSKLTGTLLPEHR